MSDDIDDDPDLEELAEELADYDLFNITDIKISYQRSKDMLRVSALLKSDKPISEMRLYLMLDLECRKLERRLGIHDGIEDLKH